MPRYVRRCERESCSGENRRHGRVVTEAAWVSIRVGKHQCGEGQVSFSIRWDSTVHSARIAPIGGISWGLQLQPRFEDNWRAGWQSHREGMAHDGRWRGVQRGWIARAPRGCCFLGESRSSPLFCARALATSTAARCADEKQPRLCCCRVDDLTHACQGFVLLLTFVTP